jgi:hypothetical protein
VNNSFYTCWEFVDHLVSLATATNSNLDESDGNRPFCSGRLELEARKRIFPEIEN